VVAEAQGFVASVGVLWPAPPPLDAPLSEPAPHLQTPILFGSGANKPKSCRIQAPEKLRLKERSKSPDEAQSPCLASAFWWEPYLRLRISQPRLRLAPLLLGKFLAPCCRQCSLSPPLCAFAPARRGWTGRAPSDLDRLFVCNQARIARFSIFLLCACAALQRLQKGEYEGNPRTPGERAVSCSAQAEL
jgi:hypothetical protein